MTEIEPYAIAGIETVNIEQGSDQLPYFYKITSGQKDTRSLVFHAKIKTEYHQYTIRQVNKKSLNLACSFRKCKAKATVKISPDLILPGAGKLAEFFRRGDNSASQTMEFEISAEEIGDSLRC